MTLVAIVIIAVVLVALLALLWNRRRQEQARVRELRRREVAGHRQEAEALESRGEEMMVAAAEKRREAEELARRADELEERGQRSLSHAERHQGVAAQKEEDL